MLLIKLRLLTTAKISKNTTFTIVEQHLHSQKNIKLFQQTFTFDRCFWSMDPSNEKFDSQEDVYDEVGTDLLDNSFQGYNACIFAYGQTGGDFCFNICMVLL